MSRRVACLAVLLGAPALTGGARAASVDAGGAAAPQAPGDRVQKRVGAFATLALGMPRLDFVNELAGARLELEYTPRLALGFGVAYVNLKGKDGRVSNVLPEVSVAYRAPLGRSDFGVPLRFAGGYLAKNGPTLRLSTGFDIAVSETTAIELALLEPMVWVTRDRPELSLNVGAAFRSRF